MQEIVGDETGFPSRYRIRVEKGAILSSSYEEERMTLDPVRPMTADTRIMEAWDGFCYDGGKCTFNQTKVLTRSQVEPAFGDKWARFKEARESADPRRRFLSTYFKVLMYAE